MTLRAHADSSLLSVGPTVRPAVGTPAAPASLDGLSDGPPTPLLSVGPTVRPTVGTPAAPASLDGLSDGPPTPVAATFVSERGDLDHRRFGVEVPRITVHGFVFDVHPDTFFQSNRYLLADFVREVLEQAGSSPKYVLDLFCGSGFFSIPLAGQATEVLGVESNPVAIRQARLNARLNQAANVTFFRGLVEAALRNSDVRPDTVLLNPPRTGCGRVAAQHIAGLGAGRVIYVSCNPSTFAREAPEFLARGYALEQVTLVDQFPNTHHIELVASFGR